MAKRKIRRGPQIDRWISEEGLSIIAGYLRSGMTVDELCKKVIKCSRVTIYAWAKKSPELQETLTITREDADMQVENALFKRAMGYDYIERTETSDDTYTNTRHLPPDVKAQQLWLLNRRRHQWKDKQVIETNQSIQLQQAQDASVSILAALKGRQVSVTNEDDEGDNDG